MRTNAFRRIAGKKGPLVEFAEFALLKVLRKGLPKSALEGSYSVWAYAPTVHHSSHSGLRLGGLWFVSTAGRTTISNLIEISKQGRVVGHDGARFEMIGLSAIWTMGDAIEVLLHGWSKIVLHDLHVMDIALIRPVERDGPISADNE